MLKHEDFIREFPINTKTDRDVEIVLLNEWVEENGPFDSLIDVGAHTSHVYYAKEVRKHVKQYDAIDILGDKETAAIVDKYYVGNANHHLLPKYDAVSCVSTLEHAGISTYKGDHLQERTTLFKRCIQFARKYVFFSFLVGLPYTYPGQLSVISEDTLAEWEDHVSDHTVTLRYFYNQSVTEGYPWREHTKRDVALKIPYIDFLGTQSLCVMTVEK